MTLFCNLFIERPSQITTHKKLLYAGLLDLTASVQ